MPRSIISFSFKGSFVVNGFEAGTAFRGLTNITGCIETFLLAETEAGAEVKAGAGTRGIEIEAVVALTMETFRTIGIVGTEAGTIRIARITETIGAEAGTGVALGIEAFSCAWLNKNSR
jgi:hypothetical protein